MFNRTKKQKREKPGPKSNYTKTGIRLVAILQPPLVKEVESIVRARGTSRRVIVEEALTQYVRKYRNGPESNN